MNLTIVLEGIQEDLQGLADLGDERSAQIARRLGEALSSNLRLKLFDLLSQVAVALSSKLPSGHIEVRLGGRRALGADQPAPSGVAQGRGREVRGSRRRLDQRVARACNRAGDGIAP